MWAPIPGLLGPDADQDCYRYFKIFDQMLDDEYILGDGHYVGLPKSKITSLTQLTKEVSHVRAIIEHVNERVKNWHILHCPYRHNIKSHHVVFKLCVHITNLQMKYAPVHDHPHPSLYCN